MKASLVYPFDMMGSVLRRVVALFLAHLTAAVVATLALGLRRLFAYDVPLTESLTPVRFLPHLLLGPVYAAGALVRLVRDDTLLDKRACESIGYLAPLLICYLIYAWLLVDRRRGAGPSGFAPVLRDRFPEENR